MLVISGYRFFFLLSTWLLIQRAQCRYEQLSLIYEIGTLLTWSYLFFFRNWHTVTNWLVLTYFQLFKGLLISYFWTGALMLWGITGTFWLDTYFCPWKLWLFRNCDLLLRHTEQIQLLSKTDSIIPGINLVPHANTSKTAGQICTGAWVPVRINREL